MQIVVGWSPLPWAFVPYPPPPKKKPNILNLDIFIGVPEGFIGVRYGFELKFATKISNTSFAYEHEIIDDYTVTGCIIWYEINNDNHIILCILTWTCPAVSRTATESTTIVVLWLQRPLLFSNNDMVTMVMCCEYKYRHTASLSVLYALSETVNAHVTWTVIIVINVIVLCQWLIWKRIDGSIFRIRSGPTTHIQRETADATTKCEFVIFFPVGSNSSSRCVVGGGWPLRTRWIYCALYRYL